MEVTQTKCDICGKMESNAVFRQYNKPEGWYFLRKQKLNSVIWDIGKDICPRCAEDMGLTRVCEEHAKHGHVK